jgi:hypothetical protein
VSIPPKSHRLLGNAKEAVSNWIEEVFGNTKNKAGPAGIVPEEVIPQAVEYEIPEQTPQVPPKPLTQELLEREYGLPVPSACALTAGAWLNNEYLKTLGSGLTTDEAVDVLRGLKGTGFNSEGGVLSFDKIAEKMAAVKDEADYLVWADKTYPTEEDITAAGYPYYLEVRRHVDNPNRTHFLGHANGEEYDPYSTPINNKWWKKSDLSTAEYRAFTPYSSK